MTDETVDVKARAAERIDAWIAALRSGEYKQTQGRLHNREGYCCLGVLCEVVGLEQTPQPDGWGAYRFLGPVTGNGYDSYLPRCVAASVGLEREGSPRALIHWIIPDYLKDAVGYRTSLAALNDHGHNFTDIANLIEANRERLIENAK